MSKKFIQYFENLNQKDKITKKNHRDTQNRCQNVPFYMLNNFNHDIYSQQSRWNFLLDRKVSKTSNFRSEHTPEFPTYVIHFNAQFISKTLVLASECKNKSTLQEIWKKIETENIRFSWKNLTCSTRSSITIDVIFVIYALNNLWSEIFIQIGVVVFLIPLLPKLTLRRMLCIHRFRSLYKSRA